MFPCVQNPVCPNTQYYSTNLVHAPPPNHYVSRMTPLNQKSTSSPSDEDGYYMSPFSESLEVRVVTFKDDNYLLPGGL